jgi:aspartyl-tRNA(Asn)/glutamyl-tRNA(Gln) amidotransferase subunit A
VGLSEHQDTALARVRRIRPTPLVNDVAAIFDDVDLILTPMSSMPPFAAQGPMPTSINGVEVHAGMSVVLAMLANLVNLPALSVPAGLTGSNVPVGLQIIGPRFREDLLLASARQFETAHPWPRHSPPRTT